MRSSCEEEEEEEEEKKRDLGQRKEGRATADL